MSREFFETYSPREDNAEILREISKIVDEYSEQGLTLTLRQLYYQLVSKDLIRNEEKQYKRIGNIVSQARRGGLLDWDALEDRVRVPQTPPEWDSLHDLADSALRSYRLPRLAGQENYVELWVEKDALAGVLQPIAYAHHITLMVNRGYSSTSAMREAAERVRKNCETYGCRRATILYLGDLDPSGEDMVRDVQDRLEEYTNSGELILFTDDGGLEAEGYEARIKRKKRLRVRVEKIGLTMEQVRRYKPPPNPAKLSDSRAAKFVAEHGTSSWEVDALPPRVLRVLIEREIDLLIDRQLVQKVIERENQDKARLKAALESIQEKT